MIGFKNPPAGYGEERVIERTISCLNDISTDSKDQNKKEAERSVSSSFHDVTYHSIAS